MSSQAEKVEHDESIRILHSIESVAAEVLFDRTNGLPKDPDDAADELRDRLSDTFVQARQAARVQSGNRLRSEYEVVRRYARSQGYRSGPLSFLAKPVASDMQEAGKWADNIAKLVRKRATDGDVRSAIVRTKGKLSAAARAVVDDAWSDERERALRATATQQKEADIVPVVGKLWDARLDACPRCHDLDGTIRPIGFDFPNGLIPGKAHVGCLCHGPIIFAPFVAGISDAA